MKLPSATYLRVFAGIALTVSVILFPFPVTAFFAVVCLLYFPHYIEFVLLATLVELLFQADLPGTILSFPFPLFFVAVLIYITHELLRTFFRERLFLR